MDASEEEAREGEGPSTGAPELDTGREDASGAAWIVSASTLNGSTSGFGWGEEVDINVDIYRKRTDVVGHDRTRTVVPRIGLQFGEGRWTGGTTKSATRSDGQRRRRYRLVAFTLRDGGKARHDEMTVTRHIQSEEVEEAAAGSVTREEKAENGARSSSGPISTLRIGRGSQSDEALISSTTGSAIGSSISGADEPCRGKGKTRDSVWSRFSRRGSHQVPIASTSIFPVSNPSTLSTSISCAIPFPLMFSKRPSSTAIGKGNLPGTPASVFPLLLDAEGSSSFSTAGGGRLAT